MLSKVTPLNNFNEERWVRVCKWSQWEKKVREREREKEKEEIHGLIVSDSGGTRHGHTCVHANDHELLVAIVTMTTQCLWPPPGTSCSHTPPCVLTHTKEWHHFSSLVEVIKWPTDDARVTLFRMSAAAVNPQHSTCMSIDCWEHIYNAVLTHFGKYQLFRLKFVCLFSHSLCSKFDMLWRFC